MDAQLAAIIRQLTAQARAQEQIIASLRSDVAALKAVPRSPEEEIDAIPGRRIAFAFTQTQTFTSSQAKTRYNPLAFTVSQDGPFVLTHYPVAMWKPTAPSTATNYGQWQPVMYGFLPTQAIGNLDYVWLSYELIDTGAQRALQDNAVSAGLLSHPTEMMRLPVPTLFAPNSTIQFIPTYEQIAFGTPTTATTGGTLAVSLPGYKIVNGA